jgi:hypothetical protein
MSVRQTRVPMKVEQTDDRQVNQLQKNAAAGAQALNRFPLGSGNLIDREQDGQGRPFGPNTGLAFTTGVPRVISHGLGRKPNGVMIADSRDNWGVISTYTAGTDDKSVQVVALYTTVLKLWVW